MKKSPGTILVTGLSGFIGRHCLPYLQKQNFVIHGVGRYQKPNFLDDNIVWHQLNLLDFPAISALIHEICPSHLLNLAWYTEHEKYWQATENIKFVQIGLNLLSAFSESGGKRFVGAGTCAEYNWSDELLSEDLEPLTPQTSFGRFKHVLYEASMAFADITNISFAWGRPFFVYGPGEPKTKLISSVIYSLLAGQIAKCSHGRQKRDFIYVDDVASAFVSLLMSDITGAVNIASGKAVPVSMIIDIIIQKIGRPDLIKLGAIETDRDYAPLVIADIQKLKQLNYTQQYDLENGICKIIDSYKNLDKLPNIHG